MNGRGLAQPMARIAVLAGFGAAIGGLVLILDRWVPLAGGSVYAFAAVFLGALILGMPLHAWVERRIERMFADPGARAEVVLRALLIEMASSTDLVRLVRRALQAVTEDLGVGRATLFLVPPAHRELVLTNTRGEPPKLTRVPLEHPAVELLASLHTDLTRAGLARIRQRAQQQRAQQLFDELGAELLLPIEVEQTLTGMLAVDAGPGGSLEPRRCELLRTLASEIGLAVARAGDAERVRTARLELEALARFLPSGIADDVLQGRLPGEGGRRREVTVIVCEMQGLAALAETIATTETTRGLDEFRNAVAAEVAASGATLAQMRAGLVVAVCGDPQPTPDHAARAVALAERLLARTADVWSRWEQMGVSLTIRAAVATGAATVGFVPIGPRMSYVVIGEPYDRAWSALARAKPGEILLCERTASAVANEVRTELVHAAPDRSGHEVHRLVRPPQSTLPALPASRGSATDR